MLTFTLFLDVGTVWKWAVLRTFRTVASCNFSIEVTGLSIHFYYVGSLFYLATVIGHFLPLLRCMCGQLAELSTLI